MLNRGQASLEQLLITGLALLFIAVIFYISLNFANDSIRTAEAKDTVDKLARTADYAYGLGPGSRDIVRVDMPPGVRFINISGNRIQLRVSLTSGDSDVFANTKAQMIGQVSAFQGVQDVPVSVDQNGNVIFGNVLLACSPLSITQSLAQGANGSSSISVSNIAGFQLTNLSATLSGNIGDITAIAQPPGTLNAGASGIVNLSFNIPLNKPTGAYAGTVAVAGSNSSECSSSITVFVTRLGGPDTQGPLVTSITTTPLHPHANTSVTVNAVGDDTTTGNSSIALCQVQLDNSGIWNDMSASDGSYDQPIENVTYSFGTMSQGTHVISVRCVDSAGNVGNAASHTINIVKKEILFITNSGIPNGQEMNWVNWIQTHTSQAGFNWDMDTASMSVIGTSTNVTDYAMVVMATAPTTNTVLYPILKTYSATNYVVFVGTAVKNGPFNMGVTAVTGTASTNFTKVVIMASHYVTSGFAVGSNQTIVSNTESIDYSLNFTGTNVLSFIFYPDHSVTFDSSHVITYGPEDTTLFTSIGTTFATRILDYSLLNSG